MTATCISDTDWQLEVRRAHIEELAAAVVGAAVNRTTALLVESWLDEAREAWCVAHDASQTHERALAKLDQVLAMADAKLGVKP